MTMECLDKSPIVNVGQTFVTKFGNVTLNKVIDGNDGQITVTPKGYPSITRTTHDYTLESFYDGLMTVKTNFFTLAGRGAHFWVCGAVEDAPIMCTQTFKLQDQNGNPINGNVKVGTTNITVLGTGTTSLEQGKAFTAVASFGDKPTQTKTFTSCTSAIIFTFEVPTIGTLNCYSIPTGADIFVDDVHKGQTDLENIELEPGNYTVVLKKSGYNDVTKTVTIELGIPSTISENLTPIVDKCEGIICENVCTELGHLVIRECDPFLGICQSVRTEKDSPECPLEMPPTDKNYIGDITYETFLPTIVDIGIGDREIKFTVHITNISDKDKCFYIDLRDESGKFIEKAPELLKTLNLEAGGSGIITLDSRLAIFPMWDITDVGSQIIKFELKTDDLKPLIGCSIPPKGYEIIETKTMNICTGHGIILDIEIEPVAPFLGIGEPQVKFIARISNDGSCVKHFRIKLYDEYGTKIDTEPDTFPTRIKPEEIKSITISSVTNIDWHAGTIPTTQIPYFVLEERIGLTGNWEALADKRYLPEWMNFIYVPPTTPFDDIIPDIGKDAPTMKLPIIILKGSAVNITGTYEPNNTLGLYIDKKLPELDELVKEFTTDSSGDYEIEFEFDKTGIYKMYVSHCLLCKKSERSTIIVMDYIQIVLILTAIWMMIWKIRRKK